MTKQEIGLILGYFKDANTTIELWYDMFYHEDGTLVRHSGTIKFY